MITFNGDQKVKDFYVKRLMQHESADEITQKFRWEYEIQDFGGIIECTIHNHDHKTIYEDYEKQLGIPSIVAKLQERIFTGMENKTAKKFPLQVITSMPVGVNLESFYTKFCIWLLTDPEYGIIKYIRRESQKENAFQFVDFLNKSLTKKFYEKDYFNLCKTVNAEYDEYCLNDDHASTIASIQSGIAEDLYEISAGHADTSSEYYDVYIMYAANAVDTAAELFATLHQTDTAVYYDIMGQNMIRIIKTQ